MNLGASSARSTCGNRDSFGDGRADAQLYCASVAITPCHKSLPLPALNTDFRALRSHRSFVRFWIARLTGGFANQMQAVAVGWQVYALTDSALDLGLVGLAQFAPSVALLLVIGHVADRYDRRWIVALCQLVEAIAATTLAVLSLRGTITEHAIFALVGVIGAARAFTQPTLQTLLPSVVPSALLPRAVAANATAGQTAIVA